jgi:hypothetical protein
MGEACVRGNASHGDGVYKSVDAGKTWRNVGLEDRYHIGAVRVHPKNPDIVYVAALAGETSVADVLVGATSACACNSALELRSKKFAHPILYRPCDRRAPYL